MKIKFLIIIFLFFWSLPAFSQQQQFGNWSVMLGNTSLALVSNASGSVLGMLCDNQGCRLFLTTNVSCDENETYIFMVNSDSGTTLTRAVCRYIPLQNTMVPAYRLDDWKTFIAALMNDSVIGFAMALKGGKFSVSRFSLFGSSAALRALAAGMSPTNPARSQLHDSIM